MWSKKVMSRREIGTKLLSVVILIVGWYLCQSWNGLLNICNLNAKYEKANLQSWQVLWNDLCNHHGYILCPFHQYIFFSDKKILLCNINPNVGINMKISFKISLSISVAPKKLTYNTRQSKLNKQITLTPWYFFKLHTILFV